MTVRTGLRSQILCTWMVLVLVALWAQAQGGVEVRGRVLDGRTGEPMARVQVELRETPHRSLTDSAGTFRLHGVPPADYVLQASTVGYWRVTQQLVVPQAGSLDVEVVLYASGDRQTDTIMVRADPFDTGHDSSPASFGLEGSETKNLASVLADDPLRAVQGMPGVTSNDDFRSQFSLRGAGFDRIGVCLDDVLLHAPFHMVQGEPDSASITIFNGDVLDRIALHPVPLPEFSDRTAGFLDLQTREGRRDHIFLRGTASASNAGLLAEGPIGRGRRGSWLAAVRQSYLKYILKLTQDDDEPDLAFTFLDAQGRVGYDFSPAFHLSVNFLHGRSFLDKEDPSAGVNSILDSSYHVTLVNLAARYAPHDRFLLTTRLAYFREAADNRNRTGASLGRDTYSEWVWNARATWIWHRTAPLDMGASLRLQRDEGFAITVPFNAVRSEVFRGSGSRPSVYAQQSWSGLKNRLSFSAGLRWDKHSVNDIQAFSPYASFGFRLFPRTQFHLAWSQSVQYPEIREFFSNFGGTALLPGRAHHLGAVLEQRLGERARLRVQFYDRADRDLLFVPMLEPRLNAGQVFVPPPDAPIGNALRGYARGFEILIQRRTANAISGWVSYAFGRSRLRDGVSVTSFLSDFDQRHTLNAFVSYRFRPSANLSVKWAYGSGMPLPGYYTGSRRHFFLSENRNTVRFPYYQRVDFRFNKAFFPGRHRLTFFAEVINVLNRDNPRFDEFSSFDPATGQVRLRFEKQFPLLPSVGLVFEF